MNTNVLIKILLNSKEIKPCNIFIFRSKNITSRIIIPKIAAKKFIANNRKFLNIINLYDQANKNKKIKKLDDPNNCISRSAIMAPVIPRTFCDLRSVILFKLGSSGEYVKRTAKIVNASPIREIPEISANLFIINNLYD